MLVNWGMRGGFVVRTCNLSNDKKIEEKQEKKRIYVIPSMQITIENQILNYTHQKHE